MAEAQPDAGTNQRADGESHQLDEIALAVDLSLARTRFKKISNLVSLPRRFTLGWTSSDTLARLFKITGRTLWLCEETPPLVLDTAHSLLALQAVNNVRHIEEPELFRSEGV